MSGELRRSISSVKDTRIDVAITQSAAATTLTTAQPPSNTPNNLGVYQRHQPHEESSSTANYHNDNHRSGGSSCGCSCHSQPPPCCPCHSISYLESLHQRFNPTDEELLTYYLLKKINNEMLPENKISDVNLYDHEPKELTEKHPQANEGEWYFFTRRRMKARNKVDRAAGGGYWKNSGTEKKAIKNGNGVKIGLKRMLTFYVGRPAPYGVKTDWIMQEYEAVGDKRGAIDEHDPKLDDYVLCKIYETVKRGGKNLKEDGATEQTPPSRGAHIEENYLASTTKWNHYRPILPKPGPDVAPCTFRQRLGSFLPNFHPGSGMFTVPQSTPPPATMYFPHGRSSTLVPPTTYNDPDSGRQPSGSFLQNSHPDSGRHTCLQPAPPPATMDYPQSSSAAVVPPANFNDPTTESFQHSVTNYYNPPPDQEPAFERENMNEEYDNPNLYLTQEFDLWGSDDLPWDV